MCISVYTHWHTRLMVTLYCTHHYLSIMTKVLDDKYEPRFQIEYPGYIYCFISGCVVASNYNSSHWYIIGYKNWLWAVVTSSCLMCYKLCIMDAFSWAWIRNTGCIVYTRLLKKKTEWQQKKKTEWKKKKLSCIKLPEFSRWIQ